MKVTLQFVSQFAHVGGGFIIVVLPTLLVTRKALWWTAGILLVGSAIKEWWDCHGLEDPATSGGVAGSWQDFAFWCVGNAGAVGTLSASIHLGHLVR